MKVRCTECGWVGQEDALLRADSPFDEGVMITGCPNCKSVESTLGACDEPGCEEFVTCGRQTPDGYRMTCGAHRPVTNLGETKITQESQ